MICVLSPAKAMDLSGPPDCGVMSRPNMKQTAELLEVCKKMSKGDLKKLMSISDTIAQKDYERYQAWDKNQCKAACLAMDGPAFRGFDANSMSQKDRKVAQDKVRILSGLYGVLRPFDAIRPYRLEMGSKVSTKHGSDLYQFWGDAIAKELGKSSKVIINAASKEYWKSVKEEALGSNVRIVTVDFPGPAVYAKKARGLICRHAVLGNCSKPEDLKSFAGGPEDRYAFDAAKSKENFYVFRRLPNTASQEKGKASKRKQDGKASAAPAKRQKAG